MARPQHQFMSARALRGLTAAGGVVLATVLVSCGSLNRALDNRALEAKAALVVARAPTETRSQALPFSTSEDLERATRSTRIMTPEITPLVTHRVGDSTLTQLRLEFPSRVTLEHVESNQAVAYLYVHGHLGNRPVVLWVPGAYVSDAAFTPIGWFFAKILEHDMDILFYVPPYHLERTPAGFESGDAFLATDFVDHLRTFEQELADLRDLLGWLRAQGVQHIGAFGGSTGASMLLNVATWEPAFDFMTLMIPVIRWDQVVLETDELAPVRQALIARGVTSEEARTAYLALNPTDRSPCIDPDRISVLYGEFDRLARSGPILEWARAWGVEDLHVYSRGHSLMLFTPSMFDDYGRVLDGEARRLRAGTVEAETTAVRCEDTGVSTTSSR